LLKYRPNLGTMMSLQWVLGFSELRIIGKYKISGEVFSLDIEESGTFWMIMSRLHLCFNILKILKQNYNHRYIRVGNVTVEAQQKLALGDISKKEKPLYIVEQQMDMKYGKMRMRLNKYAHLYLLLIDLVNNCCHLT